jgi:hypothetical protein
VFITVLASVMMFAGCVRVDISEKNGPITTQDYNFTDFTGIQVGSAFQLDVTPSDTYKVSITAGKNVLDRVNVSQSGSILKIEITGWNLLWHWQTTPRVTITMPVLKELNLSGASQGSALGFKSTEDFQLKMSGASHLDMDMVTGDFTADISGASSATGQLTATGSDIKLTGASQIELTGSGGNIKLHASGASHADTAYFTVNNADIEFSGASHGILDVSGRLDVTLSGASSLEYRGNSTLGTVDVSGASDLEHKNLP